MCIIVNDMGLPKYPEYAGDDDTWRQLPTADHMLEQVTQNILGQNLISSMASLPPAQARLCIRVLQYILKLPCDSAWQ